MDVHGSGLGLSSLSVLVVDDNEVNRVYLLHLLRKMGYTPMTAGDGHEALEALAQHTFDLILMDIQLPDMDGLTLTRTIRSGQAAMANAPDIPILALTAFASREDRARCLEAGMNEHLGKPLRAEALEEAMERLLACPQPAATAPDQDAPFDLSGFTGENHREFAKEMLLLFLELAEPKGLALDNALARGDLDAAVSLAHDLAGMTGPLRAERLHAAMKDVQEACRTGDLSICHASQARASEELAAVLAAVRAHPYLTKSSAS